MMIKKFFITGNPGIGKTTLLMNIVSTVKSLGYKVAGFYCPEVRQGGSRIGFKIVDFSTGQEEWLAKVNFQGVKMIGKYGLVQEAEKIAILSKNSMSSADLIAIDEIGPMELSIQPIKEVIYYALGQDKPLIAVVHRRINLAIMDSKTYTLTIENRNELKDVILRQLLSVLK